MKIENIVNVSDYLDKHGLSNPALEILNPTEESYRALLFQPSGPFLGDAVRIGPLDLDFADQQATRLLEMAVQGGHHLVVTPEYYLPIKTLLKCVEGDTFPAQDALWVLGCESMTPKQLEEFKTQAQETGTCEVFFEEDEAAEKQGTYFDPVAYCFIAKENQSGKERRVVLFQFKTISSKDDHYFENKFLRTGRSVYQFLGPNFGRNYQLSLATIVCSDAFNISEDKNILDTLTSQATLLHIQLNPKPHNPDYQKYRVETFSRHVRSSNCDIVCLNWAENMVFKDRADGKEHEWNNETGSAWYLPHDRCSSDDAEIESNERKGLYYSKHRRHRHVLHFHYAPAVFELTVPKVEHAGRQVHANPTGPTMDARYTWDATSLAWVEQTECADTGLTELFSGDEKVEAAFAHLKTEESRLRIERAVALTCGLTTDKEDWYSAAKLPFLEISDDELPQRVTICLERDERIRIERHGRVQSVAALHHILAKESLPLQIRDLQGGGARVHWTRKSPHTNVVKDGHEPALVSFLGWTPLADQIKNASDAAYEVLRKENVVERSHRVAVCYQTMEGTKFATIKQLAHYTYDGSSPTSITRG
jgi:hypothetical protein